MRSVYPPFADGSLLMKQTRRLPAIKIGHKNVDVKYFMDAKCIEKMQRDVHV